MQNGSPTQSPNTSMNINNNSNNSTHNKSVTFSDGDNSRSTPHSPYPSTAFTGGASGTAAGEEYAFGQRSQASTVLLQQQPQQLKKYPSSGARMAVTPPALAPITIGSSHYDHNDGVPGFSDMTRASMMDHEQTAGSKCCACCVENTRTIMPLVFVFIFCLAAIPIMTVYLLRTSEEVKTIVAIVVGAVVVVSMCSWKTHKMMMMGKKKARYNQTPGTRGVRKGMYGGRDIALLQRQSAQPLVTPSSPHLQSSSPSYAEMTGKQPRESQSHMGNTNRDSSMYMLAPQESNSFRGEQNVPTQELQNNANNSATRLQSQQQLSGTNGSGNKDGNFVGGNNFNNFSGTNTSQDIYDRV